jgi:hypothetical protein
MNKTADKRRNVWLCVIFRAPPIRSHGPLLCSKNYSTNNSWLNPPLEYPYSVCLLSQKKKKMLKEYMCAVIRSEEHPAQTITRKRLPICCMSRFGRLQKNFVNNLMNLSVLKTLGSQTIPKGILSNIQISRLLSFSKKSSRTLHGLFFRSYNYIWEHE